MIKHLSQNSEIPEAHVYALVRSAKRARQLLALDAEIVEVDYHRTERLKEAVAWADAVIHLAGAIVPRNGETLFEGNVETTRKVLTAASGGKDKILLYLSAAGANPSSKNPYFRSKGMAEEIVQQSARAGAVFRVPMVLGPRSASLQALRRMAAAPLVPLVGGGAVPVQPIAETDVLSAMVWALRTAPRPIRKLNLVGPDTVTYAELLRRVGERMEKRPRVLPVPRVAAYGTALLAGRLFPSLGWNPIVFDVFFNPHLEDPAEAQSLLPFPLTPLDRALDQMLGCQKAER